MKIIFLDIDGVLNVIPQGRDKYGAIFHQHFIDNLETIINKTGAKIVISSTWRYSGLSVMQEMWEMRDLPGEVIDITPFKSIFYQINKDLPFDERYERGYEIFEWLEKHPEVTNYVILDDDTDMLPKQLNNFVLTRENFKHTGYVDFGYGLTKECADMCINILNTKNGIQSNLS